VPRRLKRHFRGHELVLTVTDAGFSLAFVLLRARSNDIVDVEPLVALLLERWSEVRKRGLLVIA
jgi:hypothetical protein